MTTLYALLRVALLIIPLALFAVVFRQLHVRSYWRTRPRSWFNPGGQ